MNTMYTKGAQKMINAIYDQIENLLKQKKRVIVAIDGQAASGKSSFAMQIKDKFNGEIIKMDDYFLRSEQRTEKRLNEIGGNIDYERFQDEVINHLSEDTIEIKPYDCKTSSFKSKITIDKPKLIIVEGAYSMREPWISNYDLKIVMLIDSRVQEERIRHRNGSSKLEQFVKLWIPKENSYLEQFQIIKKADYVLYIEN